MRLAQRAIEDDDRVRAIAALDRYWPRAGAEDLRGFEWRYIWHSTKGDQIETLRGHEGIVVCAQFSPDGELIATAGFDGQVLVRNTATRQITMRLPVAATELTWLKLLSFSPDGKFLVMQGKNGLGLWNLSQRTLERQLENAWCPIAFSLNGKRLAAWSRGAVPGTARIRVWDTTDWNSWQLDSEFASTRFPFMPLAFSPDARWLAAGDNREGIWLCDMNARSQAVRLLGNGSEPFSLAFSRTGDFLYACDLHGNVVLWDVNERKLIHTATLHKGYVFDLRVSPDGRTLATAGADQTIRLWDAANLTPLAKLTGHLNEVWTVDYSPDGRTLVSAGKDGTIRIWSVADRNEAVPVIPCAGTPFSFSPGGREIIALGTNRTLTVWSVNGVFKANIPPPEPSNRLQLVRTSRDIHTALFTNSDGFVQLWDLMTNSPVARLPLAEPLEEFVVSPNRRFLYGGGKRDGPSWLWDLEKGRIETTFADYSTEAWGTAFSHDSHLLARAVTNHLVKVWNVVRKEELCVLRGHSWKVSAVAFSPDDKLLATGCWNGELRLWDTKSWQLVMAPVLAHYAAVNWIDFHPSERIVLTSSWGEYVTRLWSLETGQETLCFRDASFARFSPDGNTLALRRESDHAIKLLGFPSRAEIDAMLAAQQKKP